MTKFSFVEAIKIVSTEEARQAATTEDPEKEMKIAKAVATVVAEAETVGLGTYLTGRHATKALNLAFGTDYGHTGSPISTAIHRETLPHKKQGTRVFVRRADLVNYMRAFVPRTEKK